VQEKLLGTQAGDHVPDGQLELLDREGGRAVETQHRATAADELFETGDVSRRQAVGIFGSCFSARAACTTPPTSACRRPFKRQPRILGQDHDVDSSRERRLEVRRTQRDVLESVLLEDPPGPALVHAAAPRLEQADARLLTGRAARAGTLGDDRE
jgi:hypothetical protein